MKVNEYLDVLKSDAPAPGGGSASALAAAQGVGLVCMVCDLTLGKEKYADYQEICAQAKEKGMALYEELVESIDKDTDAFNLIAAAFKMPKETDEEKAARSKAIQAATVGATEVPYETMQLCMKGLETTAKIVGKSNPNAASDLGVAALNLVAGIKGAYLNVMINLPGIKAEEERARFADAADMVKRAEELGAKIYEEVLASL